MTRLGVCSMIIEPHVFEATLYVVKEVQPVLVPPQAQPPTPPPDMRFSSFSHVAIYPPTPRNMSAIEHPQHYTQQHANLPHPKPALSKAEFGPREAPSYHKPSTTPNSSSLSRRPHENTDRSIPRGETSQVQDDKPSTDPVIQMLATRAASDPNLKALMKVVASGDATPAELSSFQLHIDDLNETLKTRPKPSQDARGQGLPSIPPFTERASNQSRISLPPLNIGSSPSLQTTHTHLIPPIDPFKQGPLPPVYSRHVQPQKPKTFTPYKSDITGVVFDIGGLGDRYLFTKYSILEYYPGATQVIVSFLVTRKGSEAASKRYKNTGNYYQPVTMRLSSLQPRVLEPLARIVAPPDEVREYMESVFDKMTRANNLFLATRLPRTPQSTIERDDLSGAAEENLIQSIYSPPCTLTPKGT